MLMEAPPRIRPKTIDDYLEQLSKSVFQAGISWRVVDAKWSTIKPALRAFNVERVARMGDREIDALASDPRVIRSRPKIAAVVHNARAILDLERAGGFRKHLRSFDDYEELATDLKKRFKFVGDSGTYHFLWTVSHPVPDWHDWAKAHGISWGDKAAAPKKAAGPKRATAAKRTNAKRTAARKAS
jgi:3-methyladenine DNA glycosylase Tag